MPPRIPSQTPLAFEAPPAQTLSRVSSHIQVRVDVTPDQLRAPAYAGYWDATENLDSLQLAPTPPLHRLVRPELRDHVERHLVALATETAQPGRAAARSLCRLGIIDDQQYVQLIARMGGSSASRVPSSQFGGAGVSRPTSMADVPGAGSRAASTVNLNTPSTQRARIASMPQIANDARAPSSTRLQGAPSVTASVGVEHPRQADPAQRTVWQRVRNMPLVPQSWPSAGWLSLSLYEGFAGFETFLTGFERLSVPAVDKPYVVAQIAQPAALGFVAFAMYLRANRRAREARNAAAPAAEQAAGAAEQARAGRDLDPAERAV